MTRPPSTSPLHAASPAAFAAGWRLRRPSTASPYIDVRSEKRPRNSRKEFVGMPNDAILSLSCADRPGIVAGVSAKLLETGCNITEAHQYNNPDTELFFTRFGFTVTSTRTAPPSTTSFKETTDRFAMTF